MTTNNPYLADNYISSFENDLENYSSFEDFQSNVHRWLGNKDEGELDFNSFVLVFDRNADRVIFQDMFCQMDDWSISTAEFWELTRKLADKVCRQKSEAP